MLTCPTCGHENRDGAKFCEECASGLEPTPSFQAEERKTVTVLFCDLVGFTAASETADPEDVRARLKPYHTMLRNEIERYGGRARCRSGVRVSVRSHGRSLADAVPPWPMQQCLVM